MVHIRGTFLPFYARPAAPSPPGGASAASKSFRGLDFFHAVGLEMARGQHWHGMIHTPLTQIQVGTYGASVSNTVEVFFFASTANLP